MTAQPRDRRYEILDFLKRFLAANGYAPTYDEICDAVGLSSRSHAAYYLGALEREGWIVRTPYAPRGLRLVLAQRATRRTAGTE
jgi:repressor LexA